MSNIFNNNSYSNAYAISHLPDNYMHHLINVEGDKVYYKDAVGKNTMFGGITSRGIAEYFQRVEKFKRIYDSKNKTDISIKFDSPITDRLYKAYTQIKKDSKGKAINWDKKDLFEYSGKNKNSFANDYKNKNISDADIITSGNEISKEIGEFNLRQVDYDVNPTKGDAKENLGTSIFDYNDRIKTTVAIACHYSPKDFKQKEALEAIRTGAGGDDSGNIDRYIIDKSSGNLRRKMNSILQPEDPGDKLSLDNNLSKAKILYIECLDINKKNKQTVNTCIQNTIDGINPKNKEQNTQKEKQEEQQVAQKEQVKQENDDSIFGDIGKAFMNVADKLSSMFGNGKNKTLQKQDKYAITNSAGGQNGGDEDNNLQQSTKLNR